MDLRQTKLHSGYHPVTIGDTFKDGEYKIRRKLGYGSCSTVWAVTNTKTYNHFAMKIIKACHTRRSTRGKYGTIETGAQGLLSQAAEGHWPRYFVQPRDIFDHPGPNGVHVCIVFDLLAGPIEQCVPGSPMSTDGRPLIGTRRVFPLWMAKRILKQCLEAVAFLHSKGIANNDLNPSSLVTDINWAKYRNRVQLDHPRNRVHLEEEEAGVGEDGEAGEYTGEPVVYPGGQRPTHIYKSASLAEYAYLEPDFQIKMTGLCKVYKFENPKTLDKIKIQTRLRASELVILKTDSEGKGKAADGRGIDMWAFGCIMFEILTGRSLFADVEPKFNGAEQDDFHLLTFYKHLGRLPNSLVEKWDRAHLYFEKKAEKTEEEEEEEEWKAYKGKVHNCHIGTMDERYDPLTPGLMKVKLEQAFRDNAPEDIDDDEANKITTVIRNILRYNPDMRPDAEEILQEEWFQNIDLGPAGVGS